MVPPTPRARKANAMCFLLGALVGFLIAVGAMRLLLFLLGGD